MSNLRERRQAERVRRIAERAVAAGGLKQLNQAAGMVSLDAVCAPGQPQWKAAEPPVLSPSET